MNRIQKTLLAVGTAAVLTFGMASPAMAANPAPSTQNCSVECVWSETPNSMVIKTTTVTYSKGVATVVVTGKNFTNSVNRVSSWDAIVKYKGGSVKGKPTTITDTKLTYKLKAANGTSLKVNQNIIYKETIRQKSDGKLRTATRGINVNGSFMVGTI